MIYYPAWHSVDRTAIAGAAVSVLADHLLEHWVLPRELKIRRNLSTPEAREFWAHCEATAREVEAWPLWKRRAAQWAVRGVPPKPLENPS